MIELFKSYLQLLDELQFKLKIIHLGNILLLYQNSDLIVLAHDFGQSEFINDLNRFRRRLYDLKLLVENFKILIVHMQTLGDFVIRLRRSNII